MTRLSAPIPFQYGKKRVGAIGERERRGRPVRRKGKKTPPGREHHARRKIIPQRKEKRK